MGTNRAVPYTSLVEVCTINNEVGLCKVPTGAGWAIVAVLGIVGVVALIAAAALPMPLYYDINVKLEEMGKYQPSLNKLYDDYGLNTPAAKDPMHQAQVESVQHLNLAQVEAGARS